VKRYQGLLLILITIGIIFGCNSKSKDEAPISKPELVKRLLYIYTAEEKVRRAGVSYDSSNKLFKNFEKRIYDSNAISDSLFRVGLNYYMIHSTDLEQIYTAVIDSLSLREQRVKSRSEEE
jgi:hypothetical protein